MDNNTNNILQNQYDATREVPREEAYDELLDAVEYDMSADQVDEDEYDARAEAIHERVAAAIEAAGDPHHGLEFSAFGFDENDLPIDNLDAIAVHGPCRIVQKHEEFKGYWGEGGRDFESEVLMNPTWLTLCVQANRMLDVVKDFHHAFLEGVERIEGGEADCYEFVMGS